MVRAVTPEEAADRLAIRNLIDAYAHCADRRDAKGQMALFTQDTAFYVFMDSRYAEPTYVLHGRDALAPVFADLNPVSGDHAFQWPEHNPPRWRPGKRRELLHRASSEGDG
jgi:hypothetical protein